MAGVFISRINDLRPDEKESLYLALNNSSGKISVRSAFDLPLKLQAAIQSAIKSNLSISPEIKFETTPHLVSGIELITNGYKISWTIEDYLIAMETHIAEQLNEKTEMKGEEITS